MTTIRERALLLLTKHAAPHAPAGVKGLRVQSWVTAAVIEALSTHIDAPAEHEAARYKHWVRTAPGIALDSWGAWQARAALSASPQAPTEPDMPAICAALGFDPTNHHNAARCPYCRPAQAQAEPWLPIETAPKDMTHVLALWPKRKLDEECFPSGPITGHVQAVTFYSGGGWVEPDYLDAIGESFGDEEAYAPEPSHWMPLPAPPAAQRAAEPTGRAS